MDIDKTIIEQIQSTTHHIKEVNNTDFPVVSKSKSLELENLEEFQKCKNQFTGTFNTSVIDDFVAYLKAHQGDNCFINKNGMTAKTVLDLGDNDNPGHGKHKAVLSLESTAAFLSLNDMRNERHNQKDLVEWLIDWKDHVVFNDENGKPVEFKKAITAIRNITLESANKKVSDVQHFSEKKSSMENVEASTSSEDGTLPSYIIFKCHPYEGINQFEFNLRISLILRADSISIMMRAIKFSAVKEDIANTFRDLLLRKFEDDKTSVNIYLGTFSA